MQGEEDETKPTGQKKVSDFIDDDRLQVFLVQNGFSGVTPSGRALLHKVITNRLYELIAGSMYNAQSNAIHKEASRQNPEDTKVQTEPRVITRDDVIIALRAADTMGNDLATKK